MISQKENKTRDELYVDYMEYRDFSGRDRPDNDYVRYFLNWCGREYQGNPYLSQEMVDRWCAKRSTEGERSFVSRVGPINRFLSYLNSKKGGSYELIDLPTSLPPVEEPVLFNKEELANFFRATDEIEYKQNCRLPYSRFQSKLKALIVPVIFRLNYSTGLRPKESRYLKRRDVQLERGVIEVTKAKGHKQRLVALHPSTIKMLKQYDELMDKEMPNREYFFPNDQDKPRSAYFITTKFKLCWYKYNKHKEGEGEVVPYSLRHNYAIENIMSWEGDDDRIEEKMLVLSKSMGHEMISETMYYFHFVPRFGELLEKMALKYDYDENSLDINDL